MRKIILGAVLRSRKRGGAGRGRGSGGALLRVLLLDGGLANTGNITRADAVTRAHTRADVVRGTRAGITRGWRLTGCGDTRSATASGRDAALQLLEPE